MFYVSKMKIPMNKENFAWSITHNKLSKNSNKKIESWANYDTSYLQEMASRNKTKRKINDQKAQRNKIRRKKMTTNVACG
jgi:hypothetical protein